MGDKRPPLIVTWYSLGLAVVAVLNIVRAAQLWLRRDFLAEFSLSAPLSYLIVTAALWGAFWLVVAIGLWRLVGWARWLTLGAVIIYHSHNWLNRWLFEISEYARLAWPWAATISLVSIALTWGILWWPRVRQRYERRTP